MNILKICIFFSTLNTLGGGNVVLERMIEISKKRGDFVTLITNEPTNWEGLNRYYANGFPKPDRDLHALPVNVNIFGIYLRILQPLHPSMQKDCDLYINAHGDFMPFPVDVIYLHYPTFSMTSEQFMDVKYNKSLFWKAYFIPYQKIQEAIAGHFKNSGIILTNSKFSQDAIKRHLGKESFVIHPPVDVSDFIPASKNEEREDKVITCGRYSPEKNYEFVLRVASLLPEIKFEIIGSAKEKVSYQYYSKLVKMKEEMNLKNVSLLKDLPRKEQVERYSRAKVYFHAMRGEHFGIAPVEGMAAGLIPVVHKIGGPWTDIVDYGKYGFGYESLEDAKRAIEKAINNYEKMKDSVVERSQYFSSDRFDRKFSIVLEAFEKNK
ncbi:glycosyl transferase [Fervidicoccus fontis Kam940]|uniref:Glycosyl transferase n=1 Tax=Fervidicoccus fontis (strain DSM 19380 / JCM 18336 / VKM B-2539 / Kam940) TaxID=1163730 RepID=I0A116_FERFK|nr:glycosyl transferase [Fervidicoccus fontis Kam940]